MRYRVEGLGECSFTRGDLVSWSDLEEMAAGALHVWREPEQCAAAVKDLDPRPIDLIHDPH
jgi:hypothetical protein